MRKLGLLIGFLFLVSIPSVKGQIANDSIDLKYLEDQLYLTFNYNLLNHKADPITQNGFSGGFSTGFIKDLPINKNRNIGLGIGLGYTFNVYVQNLKISETNGITEFGIANDYFTNRFKIHAFEFPLELRWRSSTPTRYKFWRVYPGFKVSYLMQLKSKFRDAAETMRTKNISELNRWQYGFILTTGYSTWNLQLYYGLTEIFKNASLSNTNLELSEFSIGIKFYIM